jgi:hypothetical protein
MTTKNALQNAPNAYAKTLNETGIIIPTNKDINALNAVIGLS